MISPSGGWKDDSMGVMPTQAPAELGNADPT